MENVEEILEKSGAMLKGHFVLASGVHSPIYWEKFRVLQYPHYTQKLCALIAGHYRKENIQVVAGPTTGGVILSFEVAKQLGVRGVFAEKDGTRKIFRRGFTIEKGECVLIVDDIVTSGASVRQVIDAVKELGGDIRGIGVLVNRSEQELEFEFPFFACYRSATPTYPPDNCPLCRQGIPLVRPGSH